jgi:YVTN family beta-propeller protein
MGLAISADGTRLYVTHFFTGKVSVIDTHLHSVSAVISTGLDSNMVQKIAIHPTNGRAYLPHLQSKTNNRELLFDSTVASAVSVIDLASNTHLAFERLLLQPGTPLLPGNLAVNLPFDVAFSPDGARLYVVGLGSGDLLSIDLEARRFLARLNVGDGPCGIVLAPNGEQAYVLNSISDDVAVINLERFKRVARVPVTVTPLTPRLKRGQLLFFSSRSTRLAKDRWISCATCHFEGEHDGRTWFFAGSGPRNTTSLRGTRNTRPLHWSGDRDELQDFEHTIISLQAGTGLIRHGPPNDALGAPNAHRSADLDALAAFIRSLPPKPSPFRNRNGSLAAAARRGREIFNRVDVGCAVCHPAPRFTDSRLQQPFVKHNVGTGDGEDEQMGPAFDTPSLRGLWDSAPYLHDGSAPTLRHVLRTRNPKDQHGQTSHLSDEDINDLIAYLRSL